MKRKFRLYVTDSDYGMSMVAAKNINEAKAKALKLLGISNFISVRAATDKDVTWYASMGGQIPDTYYDLPKYE